MISSRKIDFYFIFIHILGLILALAAFYPGFFSRDSILQYQQSITLELTDWHPPLMSVLWHGLNHIFPDPSGILIFNLVTLWIASIVLFIKNKNQKLSFSFLLIPYLPWVINFEGVVWKDVSFAFTLLLSTVLAYYYGKKKFVFLISLILFFYAINLRHNAIPALIPILYYIFICHFECSGRKLKSTIAAIFFLILCVSGGKLLNNVILDVEKTKPLNYVFVDDLVYLSSIKGESLIPEYTDKEVVACSKTVINGTALVGRIFCLAQFEGFKERNPLEKNITNIWFDSLLEYPLNYIGFRISSFIYFMKSHDEKAYYTMFTRVDKNDFGFKSNDSDFKASFIDYISYIEKKINFVFKPYWWLIVSIVLFVVCIFHAKSGLAKSLILSSVIYTISYLPVTPAADIRYAYWSMLATSVAALLILTRYRDIKSPLRVLVISIILYFILNVLYKLLVSHFSM